MVMKAISAPRIFDGDNYHQDAALVWEDERIHAIMPIDELPADIEHQHYANSLIAPGFIDIQVNGGGDVMFNNDVGPAAIETICAAHRTHGTAYLLPTLISSTPESITKALVSAEQAVNDKIPGMLGVHIEVLGSMSLKKARTTPSCFIRRAQLTLTLSLGQKMPRY
ncbi:N-acetylglucosamine-6-phosphate deacetylase [Vibrio ponticus]|nr:N-acetylglucosamine-6-phosphate deacetylase [Vibrio ponticus]